MKNKLYLLLFVSNFALCMEVERTQNEQADYEVEFTLFADNPIRNASSFSQTDLNKYSNAYNREIMPEEIFLPIALQKTDFESKIELADIKPPLFIPEKEVVELQEGSSILVKNKNNKLIKMTVNTSSFIDEKNRKKFGINTIQDLRTKYCKTK